MIIPAAASAGPSPSVYFRHELHCVYWRRLSNGDIGIVTILHEQMHQTDRFHDDLGC